MRAADRNRWKQAAGMIGGVVVLGSFAALAVAERQRPLRTRQQPDSVRRVARNLAMAGLTTAAVQIAGRPIVAPVARAVQRHRLGLLPRLGLPPGAETAAAILLLDYSLYAWHVATHRMPLLWRFHRVHHVDLDLDSTTALRFHFGEFVLGFPYRALQVLLIGVTPRTLALWQRLTVLEVLLHHSNLRLPLWLERRLVGVIVTPRMHGIHHSAEPDEMNTNWSSGFSFWDRLHGTLRLNIPQAEVAIGLPEHRPGARLTLAGLLAMPFRRPPLDAPPGHRKFPGRPDELAS
jgi:sterol desaturase/sphingolipid hydroxylase (fatty acid hydroxylase superfamily)